MPITYDPERFMALVHYVCRTCTDPSKLGAVKLHKILWLSDVYAYKHFGAPISGEDYKKGKYGPVSVHLNAVVKQLERENRLYVHDIELGDDIRQKQFIAKGETGSSLFSKQELQIIDDARDYVCENHSAGSISDKTHDAIWEMAVMGELIPYEATLVSRLVKATEEDIDWARSILSKAP
jgi:uncharacterized protein YwgA